MVGAFVQVNPDSHKRNANPIGYVVCESGCWEWVGFRDKDGYGRMANGGRTAAPAHRVLWARKHGGVPIGLQLDHLCRNRACVRPDHLEAVTIKENVLRGESPAARNAKVTHCPHGHELSGDNLYIRKCDSGRVCRICRSHLDARRRAKRTTK